MSGENTQGQFPGYVTSPHRLNRAQMERIITQEKGSILHAGKIIHRIEDLPSEAELAVAEGGQAVEDAATTLRAEIARLTNTLEALVTGKLKPAVNTSPDPFPAPPPGQDAAMLRQQLEALLGAQAVAPKHDNASPANPPPPADPAPKQAPAPEQAADPKQAQRDAVLDQKADAKPAK